VEISRFTAWLANTLVLKHISTHIVVLTAAR